MVFCKIIAAMKYIPHNKYTQSKNYKEIVLRYPRINNSVPENIVYSASPSTYITWIIKCSSKELDPFEIHELLIECFGDIIETTLQIGFVNERFIYKNMAIPYYFNFLAPTSTGELKRFCTNGSKLAIKKKPEKDGSRILFLSNLISIYSDYPKEKGTGKLTDFSKFAPQNREAFNSGFAKFLKAIDGVVTDWEPKQGIYPNPKAKQIYKNQLDWLAEEIDQYGYKALSERKEEYEKQQSEPPKSPGFFARLFNRIK